MLSAPVSNSSVGTRYLSMMSSLSPWNLATRMSAALPNVHVPKPLLVVRVEGRNAAEYADRIFVTRMSDAATGNRACGPSVPELASLQEGHYSLVVERGIVIVHPMSCLRHHHLRFTFEAAFEFGGDEKSTREASLSRHQERRAGQFPQISTVERR